ncbi:hypothetical protein GTHT12_03699 (plasmid) [Geobacillus thermodenitrificans]|nr:hypothetical protein GTHT12_03699 [Geobacillus thermodenitrificans]
MVYTTPKLLIVGNLEEMSLFIQSSEGVFSKCRSDMAFAKCRADLAFSKCRG